MTTELSDVTINISEPSDIIRRLIKAYKKSERFYIYILLSVFSILTIACSVCFIFVKMTVDNEAIMAIPLTIGANIFIAIFILCIMLYFASRQYRFGFEWMNHIQHIIQLDGELWHKQIDLLRRSIPPKYVGNICQPMNYDRFRMNTSGHILFAEKGIIIDEIFAIEYNTLVICRADLVNDTIDTGPSIQLLLSSETSISASESSNDTKRKEFELTLFMGSYHPTQTLVNICDSILANSDKCLNAAGCFKHTDSHLQAKNSFNF